MHAFLFLFIPDNDSVPSKAKETVTLLTTSNDSERPYPTESTSVHLVVPSPSDSTDERLHSSDRKNSPVLSSSVENSLVIDSTATESHQTVLSRGADGFSSNIEMSYSTENMNRNGESDLESQSLSARDSSTYLTLVVSSTSTVILSSSTDDGSLTIVEQSSSSFDDILTPSATPAPEYSSSPTDESSILDQVSSNSNDSPNLRPMSAGQTILSSSFTITDSSQVMKESSSPVQSQTFSDILKVNSSAVLSFSKTTDPNVSSFVSDEIFPTQSENIFIATPCSDQECLASMQSTNTVVSSSEHDLSFNTLTLNTDHASSTVNPQISSELSSDLISPASSNLHEELTSNTSDTVFPSTDVHNESTITKSSPPVLQEVTTYDSVVTFESATSEQDCCVTVFTDSVSIFPATRTEPSPTGSSTESSFTTLVPPIITSIQETSPLGVSSSISSSTISETTTIEPTKPIESTTPLFKFLNVNTTTEMPAETVSNVTTTTQTTTTEQITKTVTTNPSTVSTPSSTVTTTLTATTTTTTEPPPETTNASSSLTTESGLPVSTEKMLNTSDAFSEYWVVTGMFPSVTSFASVY